MMFCAYIVECMSVSTAYKYWESSHKSAFISPATIQSAFICPCIANILVEYNQQDATFHNLFISVRVKWSRYRPGVTQRLDRGIALLFHDRGTRRRWVVSSTPRPHFTSGKDPVPILQEAGWAPGPVWMGGKSRPHRDSIPDRPARSQSVYRLSYPAHFFL